MLYIIPITLSLSLLACFIVINLCKKFSIYDKTDPRKIHNGNIPRLGGIAVFSVFYLVAIIYSLIFHKSEFSFLLPFLIGGLIIFITGIIDDFLDLPARLKFVFQCIAALCVALSPCYFDEIFGLKFPFEWVTGRVITFGWIIFVMNAYNLIDGLDWLCSGLSFFTVLTFGIIFTYKGFAVGNIAFILCASILGFMYWNKPPAKIFMGDGGSLSLGYAISVLPLMLQNDSAFNFNKIFLSAMIVSIPCIDVIAAIWRRKREGRSFFSPDRAHLHHKLLNIGFSKFTILFLLYTVQILISLIAILTLFISKVPALFLIVTSLIFIILLFAMLHYINRAVNQKHIGQLEDRPGEEKKL